MKLDVLIVEPFMDMLLQVVGYLPTLLVTLGLLILGYLFAHAMGKLVTHLFKSIEFDTVSETMGINQSIEEGVASKISQVGCLDV